MPQAQPLAAQQGNPGGHSPQALAKRILIEADEFIYWRDGMAQRLLDIVRQAQDPAQGIVEAMMTVLRHLRHQEKRTDPRVVYLAAPKVALMIAALAARARLIPDDLKILPEIEPLLKQAISLETGIQPIGAAQLSPQEK